LFLAPTLVLYLAFIIYPVVRTIYNSFNVLHMERGMAQEFVGLRHYTELLTTDKTFQLAVQHSLVWAFVSPVLEISLAFLLALTLYSGVPLGRFFRMAWFSPMLLSYVVVGIVWRWIYNYDWGIANALLRSMGLNALATNWLGNLTTVLPALILVSTWMFTGFNMVVLLAALHSIPPELIEAARIDGAGGLRVVVRIILPLLRDTVASLAILCFIGKMKIFDLVWVMTKGGPMWGSETVATYVIKRAFHWNTLDLGYPSAVAVLWFVVIFACSLLWFRLLRRRVTLEY
jgi:multiple sugar transport system permease protein/raffinose/stachyose/melibiose transport system permease protein